MAATANWYGQHFVGQYSTTAARRINFTGDTLKVMLTTNAYTVNQDTDDFINDVNANEVSSANYTAGGLALTTRTVTYDSATNETRFDCDDPSWTPVTFTTRRAVFYSDTGAAATSPLMGWHDFGADQTVGAATFTIQLAVTGAFKITAA